MSTKEIGAVLDVQCHFRLGCVLFKSSSAQWYLVLLSKQTNKPNKTKTHIKN